MANFVVTQKNPQPAVDGELYEILKEKDQMIEMMSKEKVYYAKKVEQFQAMLKAKNQDEEESAAELKEELKNANQTIGQQRTLLEKEKNYIK